MEEALRLQGKSAIVTGAGRGIGKAIARKFLQEGAEVFVCDVEDDRLEEVLGELASFGTVHGEAADVTSREEVEELVGRARGELGRIDVLVNNAGIARYGRFLEITDQDWNDTLAVNLTGIFLCSQVAARVMRDQGSGAIVNMASTNGILGEPDLPPTTPPKRGSCSSRRRWRSSSHPTTSG
jgi:3-oxoacyl-[acyl-carrier protein] reductase